MNVRKIKKEKEEKMEFLDRNGKWYGCTITSWEDIEKIIQMN